MGSHGDGPSTARNDQTEIVLRWIDSESVLDQKQIEQARAKLPALREALSEWSTLTRKGAKDL
jgi:hypothetical protein